MRRLDWKKSSTILLLVFSMFAILKFSAHITEFIATELVIIDGGTQYEYHVPSDSTRIYESGIESPFVQSSEVISSLVTNNFEGLSTFEGVSIVDVKSLQSGKYLVLVNETNSDDVKLDGGTTFNRSYLLIVNNLGIILESYNVATHEVGEKFSVYHNSFTTSAEDTCVNSAIQGQFINDSNGYTMYYMSCYNNNAQRNVLKIDASGDLNTITYNKVENAKYSYPLLVNTYNQVTGKYVQGQFLLTELVHDGQTVTQRYQTVDESMNQVIDGVEVINIPTWEEITNNQYYNGFRTIESNIYQRTNGQYFGVVTASSVAATPNDSELTKTHGIIKWDENGNILNQYFLGLNTKIELLTDLSTNDKLYFIENGLYLKIIDLNTFSIETVKSLPSGSDLTIVSSEDGYTFYGYVSSTNSEFAQYGQGPGIIIGSFDNEFNITSAKIIPIDSELTVDVIEGLNGELFFYGNIGEDKSFANEPTADTNGIDGNGWIDKSILDYTNNTTNDVYMGAYSFTADYAPAISAPSIYTINNDQFSHSQMYQLILEQIKVYDTYDLSSENPENIGLSSQEITNQLRNRINRNPNNLANPIDWEALGLDVNQIGAHPTKVFITDSAFQVTATTMIINIVNDNTVINDNYALAGDNIHLTLDQSKNISANDIKNLGSALAWNLSTGETLTNYIQISTEDLSKIKASSGNEVIQIKLTLTKGSKTLEKQISVYIGGVYIPQSDVVVFAKDFTIDLSDAKDITLNQVLNLSQFASYYVKLGEEVSIANLTIDFSAVLGASQAGTYPVTFKIDNQLVEISANLVGEDSSIIDQGEGVSGYNVVLKLREIENLTNKQLANMIKTKSQAVAWNISSSENVEVKVDISKVNASVGIYNVNLYTTKNTSKQIYVYILENPVCNVSSCSGAQLTTVLSAMDFQLDYEQIPQLSKEFILKQGNAQAYELATKEPLAITVNYANISAKPGTYGIDFSTANDLKLEVKATIGDQPVVSDTDELAISADNVYYTLEELATFTNTEQLNADILSRSQAVVWRTKTNQIIDDILVNNNGINLNTVSEVTTQATNLTVAEGTKLIKEQLADSSKLQVIGEVGLYAENIGLSSLEVADLTATKLLGLTKANAWDLTTLSSIEISDIDFSKVKPTQGAYPITFLFADDEQLTTTVFVSDTNRPVLTKGGYVISSEDIEIENYQDLSENLVFNQTTIVNQSTYENVQPNYIDLSGVENDSGVYTLKVGVDSDNYKNVRVLITNTNVTTKVSKFKIALIASILILIIISLCFKKITQF